jgi:hypothetical protein
MKRDLGWKIGPTLKTVSRKQILAMVKDDIVVTVFIFILDMFKNRVGGRGKGEPSHGRPLIASKIAGVVRSARLPAGRLLQR